MEKVLFILGPTGVGKSKMAVDLAQKFNGEIISADSVQVFCNLDIGSAKITKEEMQNVPHHCIDILPPDAEFSVFEFVEMTKKKIEEIVSRHHLPIIVGGTGLYVKALILGYDFGGSGKKTERREELRSIAKEKGLDFLYEKLVKMSPEMAENISRNDEKRIVRAIEICELGEKPKMNESNIDAMIFSLDRERSVLYDKINKRVDKMISDGLVDEVKGLLKKGLNENNQSMKAIGYKEVVSYLKNEISYDEMVELIKKHSRNYAKRQLTFNRGIEGLTFIDVENYEQAKKDIEKKVGEWL